MRKEISEKEKQEKLWLIERKESLSMSEKYLSEQERIVREEVKAADELLNDATKKLEEALSASICEQNKCFSCQDDFGHCS